MLLAATDIPAAPVLICMALGVLVAIVGHAAKSQRLVVTGLTILFMATAAMIVGAYIAYESDPAQDSRPKKDPREPGF